MLFKALIPSPLGDLIAVADTYHLLMLEFADNPELKRKISNLTTKQIVLQTESFGLSEDEGKSTILNLTKLELWQYFEGKRKIFTIPVTLRGTEFQMKAWKALESIPYGETRNYLEEATMIGNPRAVRAIGGANHHNPIVIIIPCHRVIGKSGKLVGYGGGMERKKWLLEHEKGAGN